MPSGLDLLNDNQSSGNVTSGLNLLDEPVVKPPAKVVTPTTNHDATRQYFESGGAPWAIPQFQNIPLNELGTPSPPGGYDEKGKPLDENGVAYGTTKIPDKYTGELGYYNEPKRNFLQKIGDEFHKLFTNQAEEKAKAAYSIIMAEQLGVRPSDISPDLYTAFMLGMGQSVHGLIGQVKSKKTYPKINPIAIGEMPTMARLLQGTGQVVGDLPYMAAGAFAGGVAGGGNPVTVLAGAFAVPEGLRAHYAYELEHGDINTPQEYIEDIKRTAVSTGKGMITGAATGTAGKLSAPLGPLLRLGTEASTMAAVGSALEGKFPSTQDLFDSAVLMVGMHGVIKAPEVAGRMKDFWVKTGRMPQDIVQDAQGEPKLADWLVKGGTIPEDVIQKAQEKVDATSRQQAELAARAEAAANKVNIEDLIANELMVKGDKIDEVTNTPKPLDEMTQEEINALPGVDYTPQTNKTLSDLMQEQKAKSGLDLLGEDRLNDKQTYQDQADKLGIEFAGMQEFPGKGEFPMFTDLETKSTFTVMPGDDVGKKLAEVRDSFKEPVLNDEMKTAMGLPLPEGLSTHDHPLRDQDVEHTNTMSKIFKEQLPKTNSPETFTRYLINEVNRYLNGEDVPIDQVRDGLSSLATRASEVEHTFPNELYFDQWKRTVSEAARWARNADRLNNKQTPSPKIPVSIEENYTYQGDRKGSSMGPNDVQLVAKNSEGNDVGRLWYTKEKEGFTIRKIEVDPKFQRNGIATELMRKATEKAGPYKGATDFTDEGRAFVDSLNNKQTTGTTLNMGVDPTQLGPFFSKMKKLVEEKMGGRMNATDFVNFLLKNGVSRDEGQHFVNTSGLIDKTTLSKQEVLDALKANEVKLEDVVLGEPTGGSKDGYGFTGAVSEGNQTQYGTWQLPGGKPGSYREMFVTAPIQIEKNTDQFSGTHPYRVGTTVYHSKQNALDSYSGPKWNDGHSAYSNIQNPVVRIRFNEREVDGKRILFIEEMQGPSDAEQSKMPDYLRKRIYDIGTKRILAYAKEKGYDGVAWTTGEQQAERYDLSKQIKELSYYKNANGTYDLAMRTTDGHIVTDAPRQLKPEQIEQYVGKELAKKIISDEYTQPKGKVGLREGGIFTDTDLKVGGEGLKYLYDKQIPSLMKKYGKGEVSNISLRPESGTQMQEAMSAEMQRLRDTGHTGTFHEIATDARANLLGQSGVSYIPITEKTPSSFPLYSGIDPIEGSKAIIDAAKRAKKYVEQARAMKEFKPGIAYEKTKEELTRSVVDRSGNIRKDMLDELSDEGYRILQTMYLSKGASAKSAEMLKQMRKEVYAGLSKNERRVLDTVILMDRMLDIGKYKTEKQFKFPKGATPVEAAAYRELYQYIEQLTPEQAANIERKAQAYFDWMKKPLKDMLDGGLISQEEYNNLISHNYRRLKLVDIYDRRYNVKVGATKRSVYASGVEALSHGRDTDIFEPSSEIMALEVFNRAYGRIMNNEANLALLDLARKDPNNSFVRFKGEGDAKMKIPSGWNRIFVYEKGERKALYLSPLMSKEWITNSPEVSYKFGQVLRYLSGAPILRTFATGINWGFALANLPRDIMHAWYATRVFEDGKWKPLYSNIMPVFMTEMAHDQASVFMDALLRKGRYKDYINEGGGMEFMVHQGRLFQRGRHIEGPLDKISDFLGYFGETSELMTRLAIRERALRKGKPRKEATFAARDYMDFAQGGGITKALDNGMPYLNAGIQGTRGFLRALKDNPTDSAIKLSQFALLVTGMYIAANKFNPQTMKSLQGSQDQQNNICIPIGDQFSYIDEHGQTRYPYVKIPIDQNQKFFKALFEGATDKWLGNPVDVDRITGALSSLSPVGISVLPPTRSGVLGYVQNKNFWLNEEIWNSNKNGGPYSWPNSKEEFIPGKTPQAMIDFGAVTGLSPERTKYAIEQLITKDNIFTTLGGGIYERAFGQVQKAEKEMILAEALSKSPGVRRFIGVTNPYSQFAAPIKEGIEQSSLERFIQNRGLDAKFEGYLGGKVDRSEVFEYINSFNDRDVRERLKDRFKFAEKISDLPNRAFWLSLKGVQDVKERARLYQDRLDKASPEEYDRIMTEEVPIVKRAGGIISDEFRKEVIKIRSE